MLLPSTVLFLEAMAEAQTPNQTQGFQLDGKRERGGVDGGEREEGWMEEREEGWMERSGEKRRGKERRGEERGRARNEEASRVERKEREEKSGVTERRVEQQ